MVNLSGPARGWLNRDGGFDAFVGVVADELDVVEVEVFELGDAWVELYLGEGARVAGELFFHLLEVVLIDVEVAEGVDELLGLKAGYLRDHAGEQGVGGDVERDAEEEVGAALVELATETAVFGHIKLE